MRCLGNVLYGFIHVVPSKYIHLFGGVFCCGVAGEVSDLSRVAGLLLFGSWCGIGGCGGSLFGLLGLLIVLIDYTFLPLIRLSHGEEMLQVPQV